MNKNETTLLLAFVGLAMLGGLIQWITGSATGWLALGGVVLMFGIFG
jgi:hypothetical protein